MGYGFCGRGFCGWEGGKGGKVVVLLVGCVLAIAEVNCVGDLAGTIFGRC